ncbi:isochorismatase [Xylariales sp. PMI_506]|nr:isochorismatase [Xylariales sp. PMI_506]
MAISASKTALLLIDIQKGFDHPSHWGNSRSTPDFEKNIASLLAAFRGAGAHVLHVCHHSLFESSPLHPSKTSAGFMSYAAPVAGELVFPKTTNSPFVETALEREIRGRGIRRLVICGLMTAHCVSSTVRMAANLGVVEHLYGTPFGKGEYEDRIALVSDGTATFDVEYQGRRYDAEAVHAVHLASMRDEFCSVESTAEVIRKLGVAHQPQFIQAKL